ncbi:MAG: electron transfer flavoprotein subunit beta/FixA family protein [Candidatus Neomarinimicrobiota bacterium]
MKIAVLVKQVPGGESTLRIDESGTWINEDAVIYEMNESDNYALEEALRIRDSVGDSEVVAVSMGPDRVQKIIREALAKGAERGIHIQMPQAGLTDSLLVAREFAAVMKPENFDLVLSGLQSDDLGLGQTGVILGEFLGMSTATLVVETKLEADELKVKQELEAGWFQWVKMSLPASLTIQSGLNTPRYPSLKGIMGARKKELNIVTAEAAEAQQSIGKIFTQHSEKKTIMLDGSTDQVVEQLINAFKTDIKIL